MSYPDSNQSWASLVANQASVTISASQAAKSGANSLSIFNAYRTGVGYLDLTNVQPMRTIELGLKFRF
ncbi:hypothetical protein SBA3_3880016 [Candidatus Sulfopaludibacter sp. SbA3]|nr:hypothetical protein SBA3_3880016 [Candidatus Sulfopaludibacter sp. SbA3]